MSLSTSITPSTNVLIDSHIHLAEPEYREDLDTLLQDAQNIGVSHCIVPATSRASWKSVLELAQKHSQILPSLGLQPHDAIEYDSELVPELEKHCSEIVAIGEIGLDFHYDLSPHSIQIECFQSQLYLAKERHLPVILHCRDSEEEFLQSLNDVGISSGVVHCCTCEWSYVKKFLDMGLYVGITGMVTFPKLYNVHKIAQEAPLDRILVETDGPYLAPKPHRGKRNCPAYVAYVSKRVAELRSLNDDEVRYATTQNAISLFRLNKDKI